MTDDRPPERPEDHEEEVWIAGAEETPPPPIPQAPPPVPPRDKINPGYAILGFLSAFILLPVTIGIGVQAFGPPGVLLGLIVPAGIAIILWNKAGWRSFFIGVAIGIGSLILAGGICVALVVVALRDL
jgi:hypothetical protein